MKKMHRSRKDRRENNVVNEKGMLKFFSINIMYTKYNIKDNSTYRLLLWLLSSYVI